MTDTFAIPNPNSLRPVMLRVWEAVNAEVKGEQEAVQVVIKKMSKRSAEANALMWVRLHELAAQTDWHGIKLSPDEFKDLLSAGLVKSKVVPNIDGTGFVIVGQRTSKFTVAQMNDMITLIEAFGSERGVRFSADPRIVPKAKKQQTIR
ncbi:recombination protein NinB [Paludibacterium denitrificans]|uniref:Recombination protein NinB n=1 Tax=Paludibacterium denitrificans TaxID=2675226 RepID=A0A844GE25_9NEIS|nr:recombination protein NinB [Paludibacterium denitrificans]MTD34012.1 recombination protein NinB [Paludibacterium denitrificans]